MYPWGCQARIPQGVRPIPLGVPASHPPGAGGKLPKAQASPFHCHMHKGSRSGKWLRKAGGLFPPTPFRARRAVSVTSVVQNAVLYIGIENAFWVKKPCRKAKDSFNGLKRKSALDRHATVHWMDTTASIQLKFMRPLDGQTRYNPIETCVSMGWTQRPPPHAGNLSPGIAAA